MAANSKVGDVVGSMCGGVCAGSRNHRITHIEENNTDDVVDGVGHVTFYDFTQILRCGGCDFVSMARYTFNSGDFDQDFDPSPVISPWPPMGNWIRREHVPHDIYSLYEEARRAGGAGSTTGAVGICRMLLMHIAVENGAKKKKTFEFYVDYLLKKGYLPPTAKPWADEIRKQGNAVNHKLKRATPMEARHT